MEGTTAITICPGLTSIPPMFTKRSHCGNSTGLLSSIRSLGVAQPGSFQYVDPLETGMVGSVIVQASHPDD